MRHPERIEDYLQHIAEAINRITGYVQGIDNAAALERDHKTQAAVIRYIEIIGEAANRIQKQEPESAVESVPGKVNGAWVFRDSRMPAKLIFENLEDGMDIDEITEQ